MTEKMIYIIGSLANPEVPVVANKLRKLFPQWEIFDSWYSPGPEADEYWRKYEKEKGITYKEALKSWAATHIFEFDKFHISRATDVIMVMPAGKSGHLELGWALGQGNRGYVLFNEEPKKWDIMYQFATDVFFDFDELTKTIAVVLKRIWTYM